MIAQDLSYALRTLRRSPGFTLVAVIVLAVAIGGNTAIFSVIDSVLLRPLPYPDADRIVILETNNQLKGLDHFKFAPADFVTVREHSSAFESVASFEVTSIALSGNGDAKRIEAAEVSAQFFHVLRTSPMMGRGFMPADDQRGAAAPGVILSYSLWQREFGGDASVLGRQITLDGSLYSIIGILPAGFGFAGTEGTTVEMWMPSQYDQKYLASHGHEIGVVSRLKDGVSLSQAQAQMHGMAAQLAQENPSFNAGWDITVTRLQDRLIAKIKPSLLILFAAMLFVLLIAVVNLANLLVARGFMRQRDIAVRLSLGATPSRVIRQSLTESMLISIMGAALGIMAAFLSVPALSRMGDFALPGHPTIALDWRVLSFALLLSIGTGVLFGIAPALLPLKAKIIDVLRQGGGGTLTSRTARHRQRLLLLVEMASTLVLLIAAGLSIQSFSRILHVDPGFEATNVLTMRLSLPDRKYSRPEQRIAFAEDLQQRILALPGVRAAGLSNTFPFTHDMTFSFTVEGSAPSVSQDAPSANFYAVTPGYFQAMGISMMRGRNFSVNDRQGADPVVIINETLAHKYFAGQDPLGRRLREGGSDSTRPWMTIVGVVRDVKQHGLASSAEAQFYESYLQRPFYSMTLAVQTETLPLSMAAAVQHQIFNLDREQPVYEVQTLEQILAGSLARWKATISLLSIFAAIALLLAGTGLYGVLSYSVNQRTRELGLRNALGATPRTLLTLVLKEVLVLSLISMGVGVAAALGLMRILSTILYGTHVQDIWIFAISAFVLIIVAAAAGFMPAARAARIDPMTALRCD